MSKPCCVVDNEVNVLVDAAAASGCGLCVFVGWAVVVMAIGFE